MWRAIATDEMRHALLAWRTLAWACGTATLLSLPRSAPRCASDWWTSSDVVQAIVSSYVACVTATARSCTLASDDDVSASMAQLAAEAFLLEATGELSKKWMIECVSQIQ